MKIELDGKNISKRIIFALKISGHNSIQLANYCNIKLSSLKSIFSGSNIPSLKLLHQIANYTNAPIDYFLADYLNNKTCALNYTLNVLSKDKDEEYNALLIKSFNDIHALLQKNNKYTL